MGHHPGDALLAACAGQAAARMREANFQSVSTTLWGFATLRHKPGDDLLRASEAAIVARCSRAAREVAPSAVVRSWRTSTVWHAQERSRSCHSRKSQNRLSCRWSNEDKTTSSAQHICYASVSMQALTLRLVLSSV